MRKDFYVGRFDRNGLEMLSGEECLALLANNDFGRIGLSINALPAILPVNYKMVDGVVVILSAGGAKVAAAANHSVVAFEVDKFSPSGEYGWSVLTIGVAFRVEDEPELLARLNGPMEVWIDIKAATLIGIRPDIISGRKIEGPRHRKVFGADSSLATRPG